MAGHSKWANIKHKKEKEDARRGRLFTKLARQITVAAREGGGDPESNFRLRVAIENARAANMPNENIERAIKRGTGELEGGNFEEIVYEGYGPGGVAILLEAMTDNRNRTAGEVRHLFGKYGGNLGESGCVNWMFSSRAVLTVARDDHEEDDIALAAIEAGAEDVTSEEDHIRVEARPEDLRKLQEELQGQGYRILSAGIEQVPSSTVQVEAEHAKRLLDLLNALEDLDDVQQVYTNADFSDEVMAQLEASV